MKTSIILLLFLQLLGGSKLKAQDCITKPSQFFKAFVVVADTAQDYYALRGKMFRMRKKLHAKIDTLGREYNAKKNLICYPENENDEIIAGKYFPRRDKSKTLSLEYLDGYPSSKLNTTPSTIAIVTLITDDKRKAEKTVAKLQKIFPQAFLIETEFFMGCWY